MQKERPVEESGLDSDFEIDDEIKDSLNSLLNIPLEFEDSTDDETDKADNPPQKSATRGDSVERELEAMFVGNEEDPGGGRRGDNRDMGLESISENELDGPESGECDTSDGELPDSPSIVVTLPVESPLMPSKPVELDFSQNEDSDVELVEEYSNKTREYYESANHKLGAKPDREVIIANINPPGSPKIKDKKLKDSNKIKDKSCDKSKTKDKKAKSKKKKELPEHVKKELKLKKYLQRIDTYRTKCLQYMKFISKIDENPNTKFDSDKRKMEKHKIKSIVGKISQPNERDESPQSSTSSRLDQLSLSSHSSKLGKESRALLQCRSPEKDRSRKSDKKSRNKSKELIEHKLKYQKYIAYLQKEREKCYNERLALDKPKSKSPRKHKKSSSKSPEKSKGKIENLEGKEKLAPVLSFLEFCSNRELCTPDKDLSKALLLPSEHGKCDVRTERTVSLDSVATNSTAPSDCVDEDNELFVTYSDLVQQDKMMGTHKQPGLKNNIEDDHEKKELELKSISVFSSVLFKGSTDPSGIPFLQETRSPSPKEGVETFKPKTSYAEATGPDELYDWNDDLSTISQSSLSPSRSPAPKVHNKALLNFLENQKERLVNKRIKKTDKKTRKSSKSRSKSPKKDKLKKRKPKHHSSTSISISPSPPPPKLRSLEVYNNRLSPPPAHLKERWRDYPSPTDRRREHFDRRSRRRSRSRSRARVEHRSRSSSEERHYRRYRSHSRSRSRSRSRTRSPPQPIMVQLSTAEKRRKLKEEHERALASLRATLRKPPKSNTPMTIPFRPDGDNYDPVVMNEVHVVQSFHYQQSMLPFNPYNGYIGHPHFQPQPPPYFYPPPPPHTL